MGDFVISCSGCGERYDSRLDFGWQGSDTPTVRVYEFITKHIRHCAMLFVERVEHKPVNQEKLRL